VCASAVDEEAGKGKGRGQQTAPPKVIRSASSVSVAWVVAGLLMIATVYGQRHAWVEFPTKLPQWQVRAGVGEMGFGDRGRAKASAPQTWLSASDDR
jgi:hypothetical protein